MSEPKLVRMKVLEPFRGLFEPKRYKVYYGGRGGAKSHAIATALLMIGCQRKVRILCARELQVSIGDSVHKLLCDIISEYGLDGFYTITQTSIRGANGSEFLFKGLRHNVREIKGLEGIDIVWVEEAQIVSDNSWELLIPSIRKEGSEIWMSFNPKNPTDPTWQRFVLNADDNTLVKKVSWRDNKFFPSVLEIERKKLLKDDPEAYAHIWEGEFDTRYSGAVYAKWIKPEHIRDGVKGETPVHTAWDLGYDDATAIWFWQVVGKEVRFIDYYEASGQDIEHYVKVVRSKTYDYGDHYVPHDAANKLLAAGGRSIVQQAFGMGVKMRVVAATSQQNQIEALRLVLQNSYFEKSLTKDGVNALMQYHFEYDEKRGMFKSHPRHDWSSHGADAAEIVGQVMKERVELKPKPAPKFFEQATANDVFWGDLSNTAKPRGRI